MPTNFPSGLDDFTNPTSSDNLNTPQVLHSEQHANKNDAIEAIEAWVGISGTSAQASHEYRLRQLENTPPGADNFGVMGWDEGVPIGTGTILNVVGGDVVLSRSGTVLQLVHSNPVIAFPQTVIGVMGQDEGVPLGTGSTLNVVGNNIALSLSGTVLQLEHTDTPVVFPQEVIGIMGWDEGIPVGSGTVLNIVGSDVALSLSGNVLQLLHTNPAISFPQELIGIYGQDEGVPVGTGTVLNVTGDNIALSLSGNVLNLSHTNPTISFPQEVIGVMGWDDGVPLGTGTVIDFGNNLTASISGTVLRVDASAGASLNGQDEGVPLGTFSTVNAVGSRIVASLSGTVLQILTSPDPQELIGVVIQDEGHYLTTGTTIDIMGSVTVSGSVVNLRVPKTISFTNSSIAGGVVFTNMVANDTTYLGVMADLTGYQQCKLSGIFGAGTTATVSGTIVHIMWMTGTSYTALNELARSPNAEESKLRWITSTQRTTPWFPIATGAAVESVGLHVRVTGGNGTADPSLLGLYAEFR